MLNNLSIKSRLIFVIGFLSALLIVIGLIGLTSLSTTNASLKTVYEDRVVALGQLERISALINHNQIIVARIGIRPVVGLSGRCLPRSTSAWSRSRKR